MRLLSVVQLHVCRRGWRQFDVAPLNRPQNPDEMFPCLKVPDRFLEVAEVTLREFFNAIVAGKDVDPSWKKAIYKVICKLDSEVPEVFKSPNCLQELLHE